MNPIVTDRNASFPVGAAVTLEGLAEDPYSIYARMHQTEPISLVPVLGMYYVVRYEDVHAILRDPARFSVGTERSTLFDTFGRHMLTVEDPLHEQYKAPLLSTFRSNHLRDTLGEEIRRNVDQLIDGFSGRKAVELRAAFTSRLPILTMLSLFGLPHTREGDLRFWYDSFELALANFHWDDDIRVAARRNVEAFRLMIQEGIDHYRGQPSAAALLSSLANAPIATRLCDEATQRNALIVFFGGISTVDALILNAVYALSMHRQTCERACTNAALIPLVVDETIRWSGPVQSATRHVMRDTSFGGIELRAGEIVNCMLAAANRDPRKFADPDRFDIDRVGLRHHLGFAVGPHHCLGASLAKLEACIALERLLVRLPGLRMNPELPSAPYGIEFRKPSTLHVVWD
jgi:cytochrome P450